MQHRNRDPRISLALGLDMSFTREITQNHEKREKRVFCCFLMHLGAISTYVERSNGPDLTRILGARFKPGAPQPEMVTTIR